MSNHRGSYMLQEVLSMLDREHVFEMLGTERTQRLVLDIVKLATKRYDCNEGEILEGLGPRLCICTYCLSPGKVSPKGYCSPCAKEMEE